MRKKLVKSLTVFFLCMCMTLAFDIQGRASEGDAGQRQENTAETEQPSGQTTAIGRQLGFQESIEEYAARIQEIAREIAKKHEELSRQITEEQHAKAGQLGAVQKIKTQAGAAQRDKARQITQVQEEKARQISEAAQQRTRQIESEYHARTSGNPGYNFHRYNNPEQQNTTSSYVLNTSSMKIHYPDCHHVKKIAPQNYSTFDGTLDEAQSQGYTTCGTCFK